MTLGKTHCITVALQAVLAVFLAASTVSAAPIAVPNFSFEIPGLSNDGDTFPVVIGWTKSPPELGNFITVENMFADWYPGAGGRNPPPGTAEGAQALRMDVFGQGYVTTTLPVATTELNTLYTLTVALGNPEPRLFPPGVLRIELLVDGLAAATATTTGAFLPGHTFTDLSTAFLSLSSGQSLTIRLAHENFTPTFPSIVHFDNVRLDQAATAVPEPASLLLFGTSLAAAGLRRYRQRQK